MLKKLLSVNFILVVLNSLSVNSEFADGIKRCKYGDTECIKTTTNFLFKEKFQGFDSINLPKLSPLKYEKVHLHQGADSPVSLDLVLTNQSLYGLETGRVSKVKGFGKDLTMKHSMRIHIDYLSSVGDYEVNGKVLILPIIGTGTLNITFVNIDLHLNFMGKPVEKDGATYMDIENLKLNADVKKIIFKVDNLFNGDKALGDNMNLFLNENGLELYKEILPSLSKGFGEVFQKVIQSVFSKYPYDQYFID